MTELLQYAPILVVAGVFSGFAAGLLGVGGGLVTVPVLFTVLQLYGVDPSVGFLTAVATSLATIMLSSVRAGVSHYRRGYLSLAIVRAWVPGLIAGAFCGGLLSLVVAADWLRWFFAVVVLIFAFDFLRTRQFRLGDTLPKRCWIPGYVVGLISAVMGIGGGMISTPYLRFYAVPTHTAIGTSSSFGSIIAIPALIGLVVSGLEVVGRPELSVGYIWIPAWLIIMPCAVLTAPIAAKLHSRIPARALEIIFSIYLFIVFLRMTVL